MRRSVKEGTVPACSALMTTCLAKAQFLLACARIACISKTCFEWRSWPPLAAGAVVEEGPDVPAAGGAAPLPDAVVAPVPEPEASLLGSTTEGAQFSSSVAFDFLFAVLTKKLLIRFWTPIVLYSGLVA